MTADVQQTLVPQELLHRLIFQTFGENRFTQDSPILPEVWLAYANAADPRQPHDLIITPRSGDAPAAVAARLRERLRVRRQPRTPTRQRALTDRARIASNRTAVAAHLHLDELFSVIVPMTEWWRRLPPRLASLDEAREMILECKDDNVALREVINTPEQWEYFRFVVLAGFVTCFRELDSAKAVALADRLSRNPDARFRDLRPVTDAFLRLVGQAVPDTALHGAARVWNVCVNRRTEAAMVESRRAVKADAAHNLFQIDASGLAWAVLDCGIDATHPAFRDRRTAAQTVDQQLGTVRDDVAAATAANSRIVATYDLTFLRDLLAGSGTELRTLRGKPVTIPPPAQRELADMRRRVELGRDIDWEVILPNIEIPHMPERYEQPRGEHGTHVAGVLAGDWPAAETPDGDALVGVCPDLRLYDIRVFDADGRADEFTIMAGLQVVAHLNRDRDRPKVHGVNLSLSLRHEVISYACGRTPICDECERLVGMGTVVVAAAGNLGYEASMARAGAAGVYSAISITDPGNAEAVITVGSTHASSPHTYGVSYFSSRGPTGDGRRKPDLVAPGEKITAPIPNGGSKRMDGTSMAAPHVSGAAALLMARHRELIGRPAVVKRVLCDSATDLGRERNFQGAGMLDILRALQSV